MKTRYIEDDDLDTASDREFSLSPSTLLGIFFLLALICAIFFGFGYSMGKRSAVPAAAAAATTDDSDSSPLKATGDSKPAPGLANQSANLTPADAAAQTEKFDEPAAPAKTAVVADTTPAPAPQPRLQHAVAKPSAPAVATPQLTPAVAVKAPAPTHPAAAAPASPPALVQIAAVSHQEDADILVSALKRKGYTVAVRHEPQDKLLHIQLGPFPTRKDADTMRQRLIADGYNAIVK